MHSPANVLGLFPPPSLSDCENAIARALLRIRSNGVCIDALADKLGCSAGTIENASNGKTLLRFDSVARLAYHYPAEFSLIEMIWNGRPVEPVTTADRLERIERDLDAIRKEIA